MKATISTQKWLVKALFFSKHWKFIFQIFRKEYVPSFSLISIFSLSSRLKVSNGCHFCLLFPPIIPFLSLSSLSLLFFFTWFYFCSLLLKEEKDSHQIMQCVFKVLMRFLRVLSIVHTRVGMRRHQSSNVFISTLIYFQWCSQILLNRLILFYQASLPSRLSLQALFPLSTCILPWRIFRHKNWVYSQKYLWVSTNHTGATTLGVVGSSLYELHQQAQFLLAAQILALQSLGYLAPFLPYPCYLILPSTYPDLE